MLSTMISERRRRPFPDAKVALTLAVMVILTGCLLPPPKKLPIPDPGANGEGRLRCNFGSVSLLTVMLVETDGLNWPSTTLKGGVVVGDGVVVVVVVVVLVVGAGVVVVVGAGVVVAEHGLVPAGIDRQVAWT